MLTLAESRCNLNNCVMPERIYKVFISHDSRDRAVADMLSGYIRGMQVNCDVDFQFLEVGSKYKREIRNKIVSSNELLVILSPRFKLSKWLDYEVGVADGAGLYLSVLLLNLANGEIGDCEFLRDGHVDQIDNYQRYLSQLAARADDFHAGGGKRSISELHAAIEREFAQDQGRRS